MATRTQATGANKHKNNGASRIGGVIDGAEALVAATADMSEDRLVDIRESLKKDLEVAREHLEKLEAGLRNQASGVDELIHENPWRAVGFAAGAGVLAGVLVGAVAFRR